MSAMENTLASSLCELQETYQRHRVMWLQDTSFLTSILKETQKELNTAKETVTELREMLNPNDVLVQANADLKDSLKMKDEHILRLQASLRQKHSRYEKEYKERAEVLNQKHKEHDLSQQAAFEKTLAELVEQAQSQLEELEQRHQCELEHLEQQYHEQEQSHILEVQQLQDTIVHIEEESQRDRENELDWRKNNVWTTMDLETDIRMLKATIKKMEDNDLAPKVAELEETVEKNNALIEHLYKDIDDLKERKHEIQECLTLEKDQNDIMAIKLDELTRICEYLEEEKKINRSNADKAYAKQTTAIVENMNMRYDVLDLTYKVKASKPEITRLNDQIRKLENYQLRFKEDLHECVSHISEPMTLKTSLIALHMRYVDGDRRVRMSKQTRQGYEEEIATLNKLLNYRSRIEERNSAAMKREKEELEKYVALLQRTCSKYNRSLNEKIMELNTIKKDEDNIKVQVEKARKTAQERVRAWINKKVLRNNKVAPKVTEETPSL